MSAQPEAITREEAEERGHSQRRSGFATREYWEEVDDSYKSELGLNGITRREKQSIWARNKIRDGSFGGRPGQGGRPRIKTVTEVIAERARDDADRIYDQLKRMAFHGRSDNVRIAAIDRMLDSDQYVDKTRREDEKELARLSGTELDDRLWEIVQGIFSGASDDQEVVDADVVDDETPELTDGR